MPGTEANRDDEIRQLAYRLWQEAGCPEGNEVENWLHAEAIWMDQHRVPSQVKPAKTAKPRRPKKSCATDREL